jgi:hypothetical protein
MKTSTRVLAGVAVTALAAAGVAAVIRYRQGHRPEPEEGTHLDELAARLDEAEGPSEDGTRSPVVRLVADLQRNQGISVARLRRWIVGLRQGTLTAEQASMAESDFDALERQADQSGA